MIHPCASGACRLTEVEELIERLEKENQQLLDDCNAWAQEVKTEQRLSFRDQVAKLEKELLETRAREEKLRDAIESAQYSGTPYTKLIKEALAPAHDNSALREYKRKVLLDAADQLHEADPHHIGNTLLRKMAEEV